MGDDNESPHVLFMMSRYKLDLCDKGCAKRDWAKCPYIHFTEPNWRRDLTLHYYSSTRCPHFLKYKRCPYGDQCEDSHGSNEHSYHPEYFRTERCLDPLCSARFCPYSHYAREDRIIVNDNDEPPVEDEDHEDQILTVQDDIQPSVTVNNQPPAVSRIQRPVLNQHHRNRREQLNQTWDAQVMHLPSTVQQRPSVNNNQPPPVQRPLLYKPRRRLSSGQRGEKKPWSRFRPPANPPKLTAANLSAQLNQFYDAQVGRPSPNFNLPSALISQLADYATMRLGLPPVQHTLQSGFSAAAPPVQPSSGYPSLPTFQTRWQIPTVRLPLPQFNASNVDVSREPQFLTLTHSLISRMADLAPSRLALTNSGEDSSSVQQSDAAAPVPPHSLPPVETRVRPPQATAAKSSVQQSDAAAPVPPHSLPPVETRVRPPQATAAKSSVQQSFPSTSSRQRGQKKKSSRFRPPANPTQATAEYLSAQINRFFNAQVGRPSSHDYNLPSALLSQLSDYATSTLGLPPMQQSDAAAPVPPRSRPRVETRVRPPRPQRTEGNIAQSSSAFSRPRRKIRRARYGEGGPSS